jgi:hypothetical protein
MTAVRALLILAGLALVGVGAVRILAEPFSDLVDAVVWLAGGVVLHDFVLAPLVVLVVWLGVTRLPEWARAPAAAAFVVLGAVTLMAVPVLGRFGARADNPTLLDRPYVAGWLVFAGLVLGCAGVWAVARRRAGGGE